MSTLETDVFLTVQGKYAIITLNRPTKLNSLGVFAWRRLIDLIREADTLPDTYVTIIVGTGRFFSAGADVANTFSPPTEDSLLVSSAKSFAGMNMLLAAACYEHKKLLVAALNGPAVGMAVGILGYFDFIYAVDSAWISTPFVALGVVGEGGSSYSFPHRMGLALAKEMLLFGQRAPIAKFVPSGFVNQLLPTTPSDEFLKGVIAILDKNLEEADPESVLACKKLIHSHLPDPDGPAMREIYYGLDAYLSGKPKAAFERKAARIGKAKI